MPIYKPEAVEASIDPVTGETRVKKTYDLIPDGTELDAVVKAIEEVEKQYTDDDGKNVVKVEWTFETAYEGQDRKAWGETSNKWAPHPGCRMRAWAQEILAADLPEEFVLNTDHLLNLPCRIVVGVRSWEAGEKNGRSWNAGSKNYVSDVKRTRDGGAAGAPAATSDAPAYEDPFDSAS